MPLPRWLLLCVAAATLLMPGKARAVDLDPVLVGKWTTSGRGWAQGVAVQNNLLYAAIFRGGLAVIDLSNPADPRWVGGFETSGVASSVAVSGRYAYVVGGYSDLEVIDVSNPASPQRVGSYDISGEARGVAVSGDYVYVAGSMAVSVPWGVAWESRLAGH
jgi:hypothetical protein